VTSGITHTAEDAGPGVRVPSSRITFGSEQEANMHDFIDRRGDQIGGASGILALLSIGGFAVIGAAGLAVEPGASTRDIAAAVSDGNPTLAQTGLYLDTLGSLLFVVFAACLYSRLRRAEREHGWVSLAAFGAALAMITAGLGDKAAYYAIFSRADAGLDANAAAALYDTAAGFFMLFQALSGLFLLLTGTTALRTGALPTSLARAGVAIGVVGIAAAAAPEASQLAFPFVGLWIIAASIALLRLPCPPSTVRASRRRGHETDRRSAREPSAPADVTSSSHYRIGRG